MKKSVLVTLSLVFGLALTSLLIPQNSEAAATKEISYKNCKELNSVYKYGVRKAEDTKNKVVNKKTKQATMKNSNAFVSANLYKLNIDLDNDGDGIACEK